MSLPAPSTGPGAAAPPTAGVDLSKPQRKSLSSLGHHVVQFAAACDQLRSRQDTWPGLAPWLQSEEVRAKCVMEGSGVFACPILLDPDGNRMVLDPIAVSADDCAAALPSLPSADAVQLRGLAIPPSLNAPLWPALLRLRPLRDFWERALRRNTVENLLAYLPDAWLLDPAPLPPGGVIPRLEIESWSRLDTDARRFVPATASEISENLAAFPAAPGILKSVPEVSPDAASFLSFYLKGDDRVVWLGLVDRAAPAQVPR